MFDLLRHHGLVNILYADGHVDAQPILQGGRYGRIRRVRNTWQLT